MVHFLVAKWVEGDRFSLYPRFRSAVLTTTCHYTPRGHRFNNSTLRTTVLPTYDNGNRAGI